MPELRFTTQGQAEALQAMERQRAEQQKMREETEKTARATADWDKEQQRTITNAQRLLEIVTPHQFNDRYAEFMAWRRTFEKENHESIP